MKTMNDYGGSYCLNSIDLQQTNGGGDGLLGTLLGYLLEHEADIVQGYKDAYNELKKTFFN